MEPKEKSSPGMRAELSMHARHGFAGFSRAFISILNPEKVVRDSQKAESKTTICNFPAVLQHFEVFLPYAGKWI